MVPVCFGLKFLRRLDVLNIRFYDFPLEVLKMVKLRYLALTCNGNLPSSISDLRKLQYLIVHSHLSIKPFGALFHLPMEIWDMKRLKHLQVKGYDLPNVGDTFLQELITLSDVTTRSCMVLNRVPNLKKLGIKIELAPNATDPLCCFDHISHLTKLKSLRCVIVNPFFKIGVVSPVLSFTCFSFSLKKLSLSGMGYPWEEMSKIASLPKLKMLKLRNNAFRGPEWELEENGFPNLQALLVEDIDLVCWAFSPMGFGPFLLNPNCMAASQYILPLSSSTCNGQKINRKLSTSSSFILCEKINRELSTSSSNVLCEVILRSERTRVLRWPEPKFRWSNQRDEKAGDPTL
ncbi:hypothetical protein ACS0TY_025983 [Phlomoides rotata]